MKVDSTADAAVRLNCMIEEEAQDNAAEAYAQGERTKLVPERWNLLYLLVSSNYKVAGL